MMCVKQCTLVNLVALLLFYMGTVIEDPTCCNYDRKKLDNAGVSFLLRFLVVGGEGSNRCFFLGNFSGPGVAGISLFILDTRSLHFFIVA
jgi:hypothetical protein